MENLISSGKTVILIKKIKGWYRHYDSLCTILFIYKGEKMLEKYFEKEEIEVLKKSDELIFKSLEVVTRLFKDKVDKSGLPYAIHLLKVYSGVNDYIEKVCALLHDVLEDTDFTEDDLRYLNFPEEVIDIVKILTKHKGDDYQEYIERIIKSENIHALNIKLSDLRHNMDIKRIKNPSINDYDRITKRYTPAYEKINSKLNEMRESYVRH